MHKNLGKYELISFNINPCKPSQLPISVGTQNIRNSDCIHRISSLRNPNKFPA